MRTMPFPSAVFLLSGFLSAVAQPGPLLTFRNNPLVFPLSTLTTNGLPGLTNPPARLMVSVVPATSTRGGALSLISTQAWVQRYNAGPGSFFNQAAQVVADRSGNIIVTGESYLNPTGYGFATIKYAGDGSALWTNRYDGGLGDTGGSFPSLLAIDGSGNAVVAGTSDNASTASDVVTIRYLSNGSATCTNRYNSSTNADQPAGLALDSAGDPCLIIQSFPQDQSQWDFVTLKYDASGSALWTNFYKGSTNGSDFAEAIALDADGNVFVTGGSDGADGHAVATLKYSPSGAALWTNRYRQAVVDQGRALAIDRAGNILVAGESIEVSAAYPILKYANDGTPLWTNVLAGPNYSGGSVPQIATDLAGNVFVVGGAPGADARGSYTLLKLRGDGVPLWTNLEVTFGATNGAISPSGLAVDSAGNVCLSGYASDTNGAQSDYVTLKFSGGGTALWTNHFDGSAGGDDFALAMTFDAAGNVYVTGRSESLSGPVDFATVKYADFVIYQPPADFVGTDSFGFVVTDDLGNTATGQVQIIVSTPALRLNPGALRLDAQGLHLEVDGAPGANPVVLYASPDLLNWSAIATNPAVLGVAQFLDPAATNAPRRFYRASQAP